MSKVGQTLRGYFWWTYPRGSVHYDVMVTLILAFIFLTPFWVNFRDKPTERPPKQSEVVVEQWGDGFLYRVDASSVKSGDEAAVRDSLLRVIEPISGYVTIDKIDPMRDSNNNVIAYKVWVHR